MKRQQTAIFLLIFNILISPLLYSMSRSSGILSSDTTSGSGLYIASSYHPRTISAHDYAQALEAHIMELVMKERAARLKDNYVSFLDPIEHPQKPHKKTQQNSEPKKPQSPQPPKKPNDHNRNPNDPDDNDPDRDPDSFLTAEERTDVFNFFKFKEEIFPSYQSFFHNQLLKSSYEIMQSAHLQKEDIDMVRNFTEAAAHTHDQGLNELASDIHGATCALGRFLLGASGRILSRKSGEFLAKYSIQFVASGLLTAEVVAVSPLLVTAAGVGLVCYQVYSNFTSVISTICQAKEAWNNEDFALLGALTVDIGFDTFLMGNICKTAARSFKNYGAQKTFAEGLEKSNVIAKEQEAVVQKSKICHDSYKNSSDYSRQAENAMSNGTSPQAFAKRVEHLSYVVNSPQEMNLYLDRINTCKNLEKLPLEHKGKSILFEVSHDHIIKPDFVVKNGKISGKPAGFHCDPGGSLQKLGLIQSHGRQEGINGIYRTVWNVGGCTPKESSFFPDNMTIEQTHALLISTFKNNKIPDNIEGFYTLQKSTGLGYEIICQINLKAKKIISYYPWIPEWTESFEKILLQKSQK